MGEFFTFKEHGFAAAPSIPLLIARHYYEITYIANALENVKRIGNIMHNGLEIGCGYGRLSPYIADHLNLYLGIDINKDSINSARKTYPKLSFVEASATSIPCADRRFDVVITWTVLQHIPPQAIGRAIDEIRRVVDPGGALILCEATRYPERTKPRAHTQDRSEAFYRQAFAPMSLLRSTDLVEIDALPQMETPGRLMVFSGRAP
jgi:ubiquinone/menaquinone biosynthesis C-methylase UbiE